MFLIFLNFFRSDLDLVNANTCEELFKQFLVISRPIPFPAPVIKTFLFFKFL